MKETKISTFPNVRSKSASNILLSEVFRRIATPNEKVLTVRQLYSDAKNGAKSIEDYKKAKKDLDVLYFTGVFTDQTNKGIKKPSGLLIIDFDGYDTQEHLNADRAILEADKHTLACFLSPSGWGLKVLFKIPPTVVNDTYNAHFLAARSYLNNPRFDDNNKGIARACFVSCDEKIYINWDAELFTLATQKAKPSPAAITPAPAILTDDETFELIIKRECGSLNWNDGNWNAALYFLAARCNDYNIPLSSAQRLCWQYADHDGTGYDDAMGTIKSAYSQMSERKQYEQPRPKKRIQKPVLDDSIVLRELTQSDVKKKAVKAPPVQVWGTLLGSKDATILSLIEEKGLQKNLLTDSYELPNGELLTDEVVNHIAMQARAQGGDVSSGRVHEIICSPYTPTFHPFDSYLKSIENNPIKKGTVKAVLDCLLLTNHHPDYKERIIKKWFGGIVGTLAGSYSVTTLVLVGGQGTGKTSFFRNLLPPALRGYFTEGSLSDDKDVFGRMCSSLIMYDDEFTSKNKTEAAIYKKLSSADKFTYRKPYGRIDVTRRRTAVLCGSANESDVINDTTGNRRIIPVRVKHINHENFSKINMDDFYRELLDMQNQNPTWWHLTADDIEFMNTDTEENTAPDEFFERVIKYTAPCDNAHVTVTEVERFICSYDSSYRPNVHKMGRALSRVYGGSRQKKINGINIKGYSLKMVQPSYY